MDEQSTPPDTITVKKALLRHRNDLLETKSNFEDDTPIFDTFKAHRPNSAYRSPNVTSKNSVGNGSAAAVVDSIKDLLLYTNPALSFLAILAGSFAFTTTKYIISGPHNFTFLSAICYAALAELAINFGRTIFSSSPNCGTWQNSNLVSNAIAAATKLINRLAALHDQFLTAQHPAATLKTAGFLWSLAVIGHICSIWTLAATVFVFAFTVPYLVNNNWEAVMDFYRNSSSLVYQRYKSLGLTRRQQIGCALSILCFIWMRSSWTNRFIGMFVAVLAVRCNLKPAEMERIRQNPLTMSVRKRAARFSVVASDFAVRTLGSKSHRG